MNAAKTERIDLRVTPELKKLVKEAAALSSMTMAEYMISCLHSQAVEDINSSRQAAWTLEDRAEAMRILEEPTPEPTQERKELEAAYKAKFGHVEYPTLKLKPRSKFL